MSVFEFSDYRGLIQAWLQAQPGKGRGLKSALANHVGTQGTYLSAVLAGRANFSPEQADLASDFLGHTDEEAEYFLLLVRIERAGTKRLRAKLVAERDRRRSEVTQKQVRSQLKREFTEAERAIYFGAWYYLAIHMLVAIPKMGDLDALSRKLGLSKSQCSKAVDFLLEIGALELKGKRLHVKEPSVFLGRDREMVVKHQTNWRLRAIESLNILRSEDLHLSFLMTMRNEDREYARTVLGEAMEKISKRTSEVQWGEGEVTVSINLDLFDITR